MGAPLSAELSSAVEFPDVTVLGIETTCDETSVGIVRAGRRLLANVVASQTDLHRRFGGVVPEVAARAHVDLLEPVIREALDRAGMTLSDVDAVAVASGPGLAGALVVGVSAAKALGVALDVPVVAVNHLEGHIFAVFLEFLDFAPPAVALIVSGGHTMLVEISSMGNYRLLGQTLDDAVGEAFDKVARLLGYGFPGGPPIDRAAKKGDPETLRLPRPMIDQCYDFSMSGLKTAVVTALDDLARRGVTVKREDVAASFQEATVDVQVEKLVRAARDTGAPSVLVCGGVAANSRLRERLERRCEEEGLRLYMPSPSLCTDNGAMIASAGAHVLLRSGPSPEDFVADPSLKAPLVASVSAAGQ